VLKKVVTYDYKKEGVYIKGLEKEGSWPESWPERKIASTLGVWCLLGLFKKYGFFIVSPCL
jgi:hypothetical protein